MPIGIYKHKQLSNEHKRSISEAHIGKKKPWAKNVCFKKGHIVSDETKEKQRLAKEVNPTRYWLGKHRSDATKKKLRIATIKQIQDGRLAKSSNTDIEIIMKNKLLELGLKFIHQYNFNNLFVCDFYIPEMNTVIECDGIYWHNLPSSLKRDSYKKIKLREKYRLLRFSDLMIKNRIEDCISIIFQKEIKYFDWKQNWEVKCYDDDPDKALEATIRLESKCQETYGVKEA